MKRAALGALLISLVAGSTAMAGTVLAPAYYEKYGQKSVDSHSGQMQPVDHRHGPDQGRNDGNRDGGHWNGGRNDHRNDRRDEHRDYGRRDNDRRDYDGRHDGWNGRNDHRNDRHFDARRDGPRYDGRYDGRRYEAPRYSPPPRHYDPPRYSHPYSGRRFENGRWHWGSYYRPHGYYVRHWVRGDRLPVAYYGPTYIVREYRDCGLRAPPYGYHWVRVDNDVVLAAIATGVVLDVVYNQFW
jgi:Ni/Co efflux regulator RcnB